MNSALNLVVAQIADPNQPDVDMGPFYAFLGMIMLVGFVLTVIAIAGLWKVFTKAGEPGWAAIIPIYNVIVWLKVINRPVWWILLLLIPFVGIVVAIIMNYDLAKSFGYGVGFCLGLIFLPFIFLPILGFGDSRYQPIKRDVAKAY